jgi:hypothetical protein
MFALDILVSIKRVPPLLIDIVRLAIFGGQQTINLLERRLFSVSSAHRYTPYSREKSIMALT